MKPGKKSVPVSFRPDSELDAAFREVCEKYATTRSQLMRRLYEAFAREVRENGMVIPDEWVSGLMESGDRRRVNYPKGAQGMGSGSEELLMVAEDEREYAADREDSEGGTDE